ncbi:MAG: response regulator [Calditerrivibrio sp.]|nr:response regulator [Calditerrivibrio sp.]
MYKILAIDDSPTMHRLFKMIFSEGEFELRLATTGSEGLELAKEFNPDIILLDFVMPKMNGFQFCKILREELGIDNIPILLITSKAEDVGSKFTERFCKVDYIAKPFQPEELLDKIYKTIKSIKDETDELFKEIVPELTEENSAPQKKLLPESSNTIETIVNKIEKNIIPFVRDYIEKYLRLETAYMISDQKGSNISLEKLKDIIGDGTGEIVVFNTTDIYTFYFDNGVILYGWHGDDRINNLFELFQDVFNVCLLEVKSYQELYKQVKEMGFSEDLIKRTFISYIIELLYNALNLEEGHYYVNRINIDENFSNKPWIHTDNLNKLYKKFLEEQIDVNKLLFDDNIILLYTNKDKTLLTDFEKRLLTLCNGENTVGKILSFFGNNKRFVKNLLAALLMTNYIKINI